MQATVTFKLSREEVIKAIRAYIEEEMRYGSPKPKGDLVDIQIKSSTVEISFAEKEEPEEIEEQKAVTSFTADDTCKQ